MWTALARLPEALRVAVILRYSVSYSSYEEISALLGVPVGTVRSRLNQVKIKLSETLLETAGLEHDEAMRLTEAQTRYPSATFEEYNRGQGYETFAGALSEDFLYTPSDGASGGLRPKLIVAQRRLGTAFLADQAEEALGPRIERPGGQR